MAPWRIIGAISLTAAFASIGWQVQRLIDGEEWSRPLMLVSIACALSAACCVLGWTWMATENARRLVGPASSRDLPDPAAAVSTWGLPFAFVAVAVVVVTLLGKRVDTSSGGPVSALPLAVAVVALLLAVPMTYRPLNHLARVVRHVGGHSARLAQWMWVPVVMAVVGVGSIVALRFAYVDDESVSDTTGWAPLWVIAVVAIAPCLIVILLAWRASSSVEEAINAAGSLRYRAGPAVQAGAGPRARSRPAHRRSAVTAPDFTRRIRLVPGAELIRLVIVTLIAGLALLSIVGAAVTAILWFDARDAGVLPAQRQRTWEALDVLRAGSGAVTIALLAAATLWTFVVVLNVRLASGRRRNPLIAAAAWPAAGAGVWWIADRMIADRATGSVIVGFVAQAGVLVVPFLLLERGADTIGARRTPLRIVYALAVLLLVHVQGLGGLSAIPDAVADGVITSAYSTQIGRLAGYLAIGALIQLCSTVAVTEACRSMSRACEHEAAHHNMLVEQRATLGGVPDPVPGR